MTYCLTVLKNLTQFSCDFEKRPFSSWGGKTATLKWAFEGPTFFFKIGKLGKSFKNPGILREKFKKWLIWPSLRKIPVSKKGPFRT